MDKRKSTKYKCLVLAARNHGLETIKQLSDSDIFQIIAIFTHKFNPKSYDPQQKERKDFKDFKDFANNKNIPFYSIDKPTEKINLEKYSFDADYDFLISISWRYLISPQVFNKAKYGAINLHRGDLPKYAGVEPIKHALTNHEKNLVISCHYITKNFDEGKVICKTSHPINYDSTRSFTENVERLKNEITQYFPKLTIKSLKFLLQGDVNEK